MELEQALNERRSVKSYDPQHVISDAELRKLFEMVVRSPSSFNLQHWRFVLVRDAGRREKMQVACYGQSHVGECSVDVVVCGKLDAHEDAAQAWADAPSDVISKMVPMIGGFYATNEQLKRDEAIRSASLAAMSLMLMARSMGLDTCPMIGIDPKKVAELIELPDNV
ncbi:MAG: nitroreductase, partial [Pseudohongiellaceae bacterium]